MEQKRLNFWRFSSYLTSKSVRDRWRLHRISASRWASTLKVNFRVFHTMFGILSTSAWHKDICIAFHLISNLVRTEYTICKKFIGRLKALPSTTACGILDTIAAGRKFIPDPLAHLATAETTYKGAYHIDSDRDLPAYCKRIQRCLITPTSVLLKSPSIDVTNRVIRHFIRYLDRFLRVTCTPLFSNVL